MVKRLSTMWETWVRTLGQEVPWRRKRQPTPVLLPRKSHGRRSLMSMGSQSRTQLSKFTSLSDYLIRLNGSYSRALVIYTAFSTCVCVVSQPQAMWYSLLCCWATLPSWRQNAMSTNRGHGHRRQCTFLSSFPSLLGNNKQDPQQIIQDFPGGSVDKNPSTNAGDTGSILSPGRSHTPWSN